MFRGEPTNELPREGAAAMYGPLIVAAAILLSIAGLVLFPHDLAEARAQGVRPHLPGGRQAPPLSGPGSPRWVRPHDPPHDADPGPERWGMEKEEEEEEEKKKKKKKKRRRASEPPSRHQDPVLVRS
jgi:hypothetical protein